MAARCEWFTTGECKLLPCNAFRNATCDEEHGHLCVCEPGMCNVLGECVAPGSCPRSTQQSCNVLPCPSDQECVVGAGMGDAYCVCKGDKCAQDGKCVIQDVYYGKTVCEKETGGGCAVWGCNANRNATCQDSMCFCDPPHTCNINGECVSPGECPLTTLQGCGNVLWPETCPDGSSCVSYSEGFTGMCVCDHGCAKDYECISRSEYFSDAPTASPLALPSKPIMPITGWILALLVVSAGVCECRRRRNPARQADRYIQLV